MIAQNLFQLLALWFVRNPPGCHDDGACAETTKELRRRIAVGIDTNKMRIEAFGGLIFTYVRRGVDDPWKVSVRYWTDPLLARALGSAGVWDAFWTLQDRNGGVLPEHCRLPSETRHIDFMVIPEGKQWPYPPQNT